MQGKSCCLRLLRGEQKAVVAERLSLCVSLVLHRHEIPPARPTRLSISQHNAYTHKAAYLELIRQTMWVCSCGGAAKLLSASVFSASLRRLGSFSIWLRVQRQIRDANCNASRAATQTPKLSSAWWKIVRRVQNLSGDFLINRASICQPRRKILCSKALSARRVLIFFMPLALWAWQICSIELWERARASERRASSTHSGI